jgi:CRP-like cAMP-binding protein
MRTIPDLLAEHPFFAGLGVDALSLLAGCAANAHFRPGQYLFRHGDPADHFYVLRGGRVQLEVSSPGRGSLPLEVFGQDDVLGWSWLVPPYRWEADAQATEHTDVIAIGGPCLRDKCEDDPALGYELLKRGTAAMNARLFSALARLLDLYGPVPA